MTMNRDNQGPGEPFGVGDLDALFAAARADDPAPLTDTLRIRLIADAMAARRPAPSRGWLARAGAALAGIGGAPGLAGMGAAGLAGVWIGFAAPGPTADLVSSFWQGAASVTPAVSGWAITDEASLGIAGSDLLSLLDAEME